MESLGEKIRRYRSSIKMTQQDFAYRLGVTGASVSAYENGTRTPSFDVLVRIANILGVTTDDLLGRKKSNDVTIDVTELTEEQRKVIQDLIRIFSQENKSHSLHSHQEESRRPDWYIRKEDKKRRL